MASSGITVNIDLSFFQIGLIIDDSFGHIQETLWIKSASRWAKAKSTSPPARSTYFQWKGNKDYNIRWKIIFTGRLSGDKKGPGERGAVLQGGVRLFRLEQERHHSHQVGKHQCHSKWGWLPLIIKGTLVIDCKHFQINTRFSSSVIFSVRWGGLDRTPQMWRSSQERYQFSEEFCFLVTW